MFRGISEYIFVYILSLAQPQKVLLPSTRRSISPLQRVLGQQSSFSLVGKKNSLAPRAGSDPCVGSQWAVSREVEVWRERGGGWCGASQRSAEAV